MTTREASIAFNRLRQVRLSKHTQQQSLLLGVLEDKQRGAVMHAYLYAETPMTVDYKYAAKDAGTYLMNITTWVKS